MAIVQVNPYSNEVRYTLGLMIYHLRAAKPCSVRIASRSTELVKSVVRYLCYEQLSILVETPAIQAAVADSLGVAVGVAEQDARADAAVFPFSLEEGLLPAGERTIIAACYNALSYKSLIHPLAVKGTIFRKLAILKSEYELRSVAGLYSPQFISWLALAKLIERWDSARYFRLEDRAMRQLIEVGSMWRLSYIVVATGHNRS